MKKILFIKIACILLLLCSCNRGKIEPNPSQIIIREGEAKSLEADGEVMPIKLVGVNVVFTEGLLHAKGGLYEEETFELFRIYDATVSVGNDTLHFRTSFTQINGQPYKEKSWEDLSKRPEMDIKTYKSYQIGISNIYSEPNPNSSPTYVVKLLIRK